MTMRLRHEGDRYRYYLPNCAPFVTVAQAVERECCSDGPARPIADIALDTAEATARLVGRLVEQLHGAGALSDTAVLEVLGGRFFVVGEK